jgi:hypothetical protein
MPPAPPPIVTMNGGETPVTSEAMSAPQGMWTTPASQGIRPRPATIHEGFSYCMAEGYDAMPAWDSTTMPLHHTPSDTVSSRPMSMHHDFYAPPPMDNGTLIHCVSPTSSQTGC